VTEPSRLSRRKFLKIASAGSALYALSGCKPPPNPDPRRTQIPTERAGSGYYVDATLGSDDSDGRSESTPWQTLAKVNAASLQPSDTVLFKRGETWTGTQLNVTWSGTADAPITFGAYGSGNRPILDGNDLANCIVVNNQSYLIFRDFDCTQGQNFGIQIYNGTHDVTLTNCDCHDAGNDNLNIMTNAYNIQVIGGEFYNAYERVVESQISGIEVADGAHDVVLAQVVCRNQAVGAGITIHSHPGTTMPYNITIRDAVCHTNPQYGIVIFKQDTTTDTNRNIQILNCVVRDNTLDGILITKAVGITVYPDGVLLDSLVSRDNTRYAVWNEGNNVVYRHCIFHEGRMFYSRSSVGLVIQNCTFYLTTWDGYRPFTHDDAHARGTTTIQLRNNLFFMPDTAGSSILGALDGATAGADIDYNLYQMNAATDRWNWGGNNMSFASWQANADANSSCVTDAKLSGPANDDFSLQADSPAINAGVDVGLSYLGTAPDCGYKEKA
jgi:hypothetical protein